jgi:hypothetical protein
MAGSREYCGMEMERERILRVGGTVGFHAPYSASDSDQGSAEQGVTSVAEPRRALGDAIPESLFNEMLSRAPRQRLEISRVRDAIQWDIQLAGYRAPSVQRETLLNACLNTLTYGPRWRVVRYLGPIVGLEGAASSPDDFFLQDQNGEAVVDENRDAIRSRNYELPPEDDEDLVADRKHYEAPGLMKL